jgi:hypothetical protein
MTRAFVRRKTLQKSPVLALIFSFFLAALSAIAAQPRTVVNDTLTSERDTTYLLLVTTSADSTGQHADTAAKPDTNQLLLVTTAPDSVEQLPDSARAKEVHPQDSPIDRGFLIRTGDGKSELRIIGSVRLNGVYDFNGLQTAANFNTFAIPVGGENRHDARFQMSAGQTRLALDATRKSDLGDIFVKVETDFLGPSDALRLRHAYGTISWILFGQTWSTFGDLTSIPLTVDLDGPNSSVSTRTVQVRYMGTVDSTLTWDAAIESPSVEAAIPDSAAQEPSFQNFPDVVGRMRKFGRWGHIQIAAVFRGISVKSPSGELDALQGYGALISGRMYLKGSRPHRILYQLVGGRAISRYITALSGEGLDLIYNSQTRTVEATGSFGGYLSYAREWTPSLLTYITAGFIRITNIDILPDDAFRSSQYISANCFWDVASGSRLGVEYSWGRRENKNGDDGTANRVSFILRYDF